MLIYFKEAWKNLPTFMKELLILDLLLLSVASVLLLLVSLVILPIILLQKIRKPLKAKPLPRTEEEVEVEIEKYLAERRRGSQFCREEDINIICFSEEAKEANQNLIGLTTKFCAKRTDFFEFRPNNGPTNKAFLHLGEKGENMTLFDCTIEAFFQCRFDSEGLVFLKDYVNAYENPGKKMEEMEKLEVRKSTKLIIINEFIKIKRFLELYQGNIILSFAKDQASLKDEFKGMYRPGIFKLSEKKIFLELFPRYKKKVIEALQGGIEEILNIEDFDKETQLIDCANFFLVSKWGVGLAVGFLQEQILYKLAPDRASSASGEVFLRKNFLPLKYRDVPQR